MLKEVNKDETITSKSVYERFKLFRKSGPDWRTPPRQAISPKSTHTPENIEIDKQLVENDRRLTKRMIEKELGIGTERVRFILTEDLGKRNICCTLAPHRLTPEQMEILLGAGRDRDFLNNIVTVDDSWYLKYDPKSKRPSLKSFDA
ncbi:HTH_48 domain-containing protein [Trichonephila clavipes]|nr:HTH_48 domain-containing protein [Trichonephila clavipes]